MENRPFEKEAISLGYKEFARSKESSHTVFVKKGTILSTFVDEDGNIGGKLECLLKDAIAISSPNFALPNNRFTEFESRINKVKDACITAGIEVKFLDY